MGPLRKSQTKRAATRKEPETSHLDVTILASTPHFADKGDWAPARIGARAAARHDVCRCAFS